MYNDDVDLTFQIRIFTNLFRLFFVAFECSTWLLTVNFDNYHFFRITSCCQYVLSRILFCVDVSCLLYNLFRYHFLCHLYFLLFDHFNLFFSFLFETSVDVLFVFVFDLITAISRRAIVAQVLLFSRYVFFFFVLFFKRVVIFFNFLIVCVSVTVGSGRTRFLEPDSTRRAL